jgi:hypothetical protein
MRRFFTAAALPFALLASAVTAQDTPRAAAEAAPLSELVQEVEIPFETFTLPNGLTTIVHTDRKAPLVGVTIYYGVRALVRTPDVRRQRERRELRHSAGGCRIDQHQRFDLV